MIANLVSDMKWSIKSLRRAPMFALLVIVTLSIGIGFNTAIFSLVDAILLSPLPYPDADRLVELRFTDRNGQVGSYGFSAAEYFDILENCDAIVSIGSYDYGGGTLMGDGGSPLEPTSLGIDTGFAETLGLQPILGRTFSSDDAREGEAGSLIIGEELWRSRYNADPAVVGRSVLFDDQPYTIVGVAPAEFLFPDEQAAVQIFRARPMNRSIDWARFGFSAKLREGADLEQANAQLAALSKSLAQQRPDTHTDRLFSAIPLKESAVGGVRDTLLLLWFAVGFVLVLACMNAANLLMARSASRVHEVAVCSAIGAPRGRIMQRVLCESLLLALVSGGIGLILAQWCVEIIRWASIEDLPRVAELGIDWRVFLFAAGLALVSGLAYGILPAFQLSRVDIAGAMKEGAGRASVGPAGLRLRQVLTIGEVAIACMLLIGAGLVLRSLQKTITTDPGFDYEDKIAMIMWADKPDGATDNWMRQYFDEMRAEIERVPGVEATSMIQGIPWHHLFNNSIEFLIEKHEDFPDEETHQAAIRVVDHTYHDLMEVPVLAGRSLQALDDAEAGEGIIIVSRSFAERYWPDHQSALTNILIGPQRVPARIVGVVEDVRERRLEQDPVPIIYAPFDQAPRVAMSVVVQASSIDEAMQRAVQQAIWSRYPTQGVWTTTTMSDLLARTMARDRLYAAMLALFAAVAILLAATGVYGVISYSVTQRRRELGIRMALGATNQEILRSVLSSGLKLCLVGLLVGAPLAVLIARRIRDLLFDVTPLDPLTYVTVSALVLVVAVIACVVPGLRATRIPPTNCLRTD